MGPITISRDDFRRLRSGDQVVWRGKFLRTIVKGPGDSNDKRKNPTVQFSVRHRSWTKRILTIYSYNDLKDKIAPVPDRTRTRGLMLKSEWLTLVTAGFDVRKELRRELKDAEGLLQRMGRKPCSAYPRLAKMIRRKPIRRGIRVERRP